MEGIKEHKHRVVKEKSKDKKKVDDLEEGREDVNKFHLTTY